jgi:hypothetical protein
MAEQRRQQPARKLQHKEDRGSGKKKGPKSICRKKHQVLVRKRLTAHEIPVISKKIYEDLRLLELKTAGRAIKIAKANRAGPWAMSPSGTGFL